MHIESGPVSEPRKAAVYLCRELQASRDERVRRVLCWLVHRHREQARLLQGQRRTCRSRACSRWTIMRSTWRNTGHRPPLI